MTISREERHAYEGGRREAKCIGDAPRGMTALYRKHAQQVLLSVLVAATACTASTEAPVVGSIAVSLGTAALSVGQTTSGTATLRDATGNVLIGRPIAWTSSDGGVATVSTTGLVTAVAPGTATITATSEGKSGAAGLTVNPPPVAAISASLANNVLLVRQTTQASATLRDANGNELTGRSVSWASSAPSVATVTPTGLVTALAPGTAAITATSEGKSGTAGLTVSAASVSFLQDSVVVLEYPSIWDVYAPFDPVTYPNPRIQPSGFKADKVLADLAAVVNSALYDFVAVYTVDSVPGWINSGPTYGTGVANIGAASGRFPPAQWPRLRSVPSMNSIEYAARTDPSSPMPRWASTLTLFHEIDHHWGVFMCNGNPLLKLSDWDATKHPVAWLACASSHWTYAWFYLGQPLPSPPGIMYSGPTDDKFNAFDLYLMGLIGVAEARSYSYTIYEISSSGVPDRSRPHPVTVDSLIAALKTTGQFSGDGSRAPDRDLTASSMSILVVVVKGRAQVFPSAQQNTVLDIARNSPGDWAKATWGRSQLTPAIHKR